MSRFSRVFALKFILSALCALGPACGVLGQVSQSRQIDAIETRAFFDPWSFGFESSFSFDVVPNPWIALVGKYGKNRRNYNLVTQILSARYQVSPPQGPGILRGDLQLTAGLAGSAIVSGPESFFVGTVFGLRYNFQQRHCRLVPYFEASGGPGFTDARKIPYSQQQDFTFTYLLGAGVQYQLTPVWSLSVGAVDQHLSNAYLAKKNYGFDSVGVQIGTQVNF